MMKNLGQKTEEATLELLENNLQNTARLFLYFQKLVGLCSIFILGCSLTATRPVQEMSNAEAALRAAKDLHADSLVPEIYRLAAEQLFKAKHEYHLKSFDLARKHALNASHLAEQAEFEAYRMGGATPEVASKQVSPEGFVPEGASPFSQQDKEMVIGEPKNQPEKTTQDEPAPSEGVDYNEFLKQQENQKNLEEKNKKQSNDATKEPIDTKTDSEPQGQTGPESLKQPTLPNPNTPTPSPSSIPTPTPTPVQAQERFPTPQINSLPRSQNALPPALPVAPRGLPAPSTEEVKKDPDRWRQYTEPTKQTSPDLPTLRADSISDVGHDAIPKLEEEKVEKQDGINQIETIQTPDLKDEKSGLPSYKGEN